MTARRFAHTEPSFQKVWLSDPATYPIIAVLGVACTGCCAFMSYKFSRCPDVRVTKKHKGEILRVD